MAGKRGHWDHNVLLTSGETPGDVMGVMSSTPSCMMRSNARTRRPQRAALAESTPDRITHSAPSFGIQNTDSTYTGTLFTYLAKMTKNNQDERAILNEAFGGLARNVDSSHFLPGGKTFLTSPYMGFLRGAKCNPRGG
jgi:hypothetical protein